MDNQPSVEVSSRSRLFPRRKSVHKQKVEKRKKKMKKKKKKKKE